MTGLEPVTPCLQSRCSSQLSYIPVTENRPVSTPAPLPLNLRPEIVAASDPSVRPPIQRPVTVPLRSTSRRSPGNE